MAKKAWDSGVQDWKVLANPSRYSPHDPITSGQNLYDHKLTTVCPGALLYHCPLLPTLHCCTIYFHAHCPFSLITRVTPGTMLHDHYVMTPHPASLWGTIHITRKSHDSTLLPSVKRTCQISNAEHWRFLCCKPAHWDPMTSLCASLALCAVKLPDYQLLHTKIQQCEALMFSGLHSRLAWKFHMH